MRKLLATALTCVAVFLMVCAIGQLSHAQDKIRIAIDNAYPPFSALDANGNPQGFEVDLAHAFCEKMKKECELVPHAWDGTLPALLAGEFDAIVNSVSITEERKKTIDFTRAYYNTAAAFIGKKGDQLELTADGLRGKRIGVQTSTIHSNYLSDNWKDVVDIREYPDDNSMKLDLIAGRIDLAMGDDLVLVDFLKKPEGQQFGFVGPHLSDPRWFGEGVGVVVKKGNEELRKAFDDAIVAVYDDGTFERLSKQYFPELDITARGLW